MLLIFLAIWLSVSCRVPGPLICVGGGLEDNNTDIYTKIIELAGGPNKARIGLVTAASADYIGSAVGYIRPLTEFGALEVTLINVAMTKPGNEKNMELVKIVSGMTGFYFGGGDQDQLKQVLSTNNVDSPVLAMIRQRWMEGSVIAGSSAGCDIMQGSPMITNGDNYEALLYGASVGNADGERLTYNPQGGFGFADLGIIDTHVGWRGRIGRDIALMNATKRNIAFGIDQNTAILVQFHYWVPGNQSAHLTVLGSEGVSVIRTRNASFVRNGLFINISGVTLSYFTHGDEIWYDSATEVLTSAISPWKLAMAGQETHGYPSFTSYDIWSSIGSYDNPREFIKVAQDLEDCSVATATIGYAAKKDPVTMKVKLNKGVGFRGNLENKTYISFLDMKVSVATCKLGQC